MSAYEAWVKERCRPVSTGRSDEGREEKLIWSRGMARNGETVTSVGTF